MADKITDPTGGAPNFNIMDVFESFGYTPTQAEIDSLAPAFEGRTDVAQTGFNAVAQYVIAHQELKGAQSAIQGNLLSEQEAAKNSQTLSDILRSSGEDAYKQAADIFTQAPKLFGQLTPDQISQYLAPTKQAFDYGLGKAEGDAAARGLGGSSIEGQAIGQQLGLFNQSVLSQGLGIGVDQQAKQAAILQALGAQRFGSSNLFAGQIPQLLGLANQSAGQNAQVAGEISGLPSAAVNTAIGQNAAIRALNPEDQGFLGKLSDSFQNLALQDITNLGQNLISSIPGVGPMTQPGGGMPGGSLGIQNLMKLFQGGGGGGGGMGFPQGASVNYTGGLSSLPGSTLLPTGLGL